MPSILHSTTTHEVVNQSGPLVGVNVFSQDQVLREVLRRSGAEWVTARATSLGEAAGTAEWQEHAQLANRHTPVLKSHDPFGRRIDLVEFHPSYHALMELAFGSGVHSLAWTTPHPAAHAARAVLSYVWNQIENGVGCPTGMAYSAVPTLRAAAAVGPRWAAKVLEEAYDPRFCVSSAKSALTIGMALTEKQGGSDLRATLTTAVGAGASGTDASGAGARGADASRADASGVEAKSSRENGAEYRITGHKWFCSAPMSDAFLTLARTTDGLTCFFVPRILLNGIWEGTGNMLCLDVLRAMQREPDSLAAMLAELERARGGDHRLDSAIDALEVELSDADDLEFRARFLTASMATVFEASLLVRHAPNFVADAFVETRLNGLANRAYGSLPRGTDAGAIVARARLQ